MGQIERQYPREDCYICGFGGRHLLEKHHIVPRRHGGGDGNENLVHLCPTCHRAVEKLYNHRFYAELGIVDEEEAVESPTAGNPNISGTAETETGTEEDDGVDKIVTESARERAKAKLSELQDEYDSLPGVPIPVLVDELSDPNGLNLEDPRGMVQKLRDMGEAYNPDQDHVRVV